MERLLLPRGARHAGELRLERFALQPGRRERLGDQLYGQIFEQIVSGTLKEGDRLPTELDLCQMFGVSRPIVREALLRLRADGLLHARPGVGTFVRSRPAERLTTFAHSSDLAGYLRSMEVRLPVEGAAARLAAERRTPEQLAAIEAAQRTFVASVQGRDGAVPSDLAFHNAIAQAAHNELFVDTLSAIRAGVAGFMQVSLGLTRTGSQERMRRVVEEHARVVEAIRAQDAEAAQLAMQYHISQARLRVIDRKRDV